MANVHRPHSCSRLKYETTYGASHKCSEWAMPNIVGNVVAIVYRTPKVYVLCLQAPRPKLHQVVRKRFASEKGPAICMQMHPNFLLTNWLHCAIILFKTIKSYNINYVLGTTKTAPDRWHFSQKFSNKLAHTHICKHIHIHTHIIEHALLFLCTYILIPFHWHLNFKTK